MEMLLEREYFCLRRTLLYVVILSVIVYEFRVKIQDAEPKLWNSGTYIDCIMLGCRDKILDQNKVFSSFNNYSLHKYTILGKQDNISSTVSTLDTLASQAKHEHECENFKETTEGIPVVVRTQILSQIYEDLIPLRISSSKNDTAVLKTYSFIDTMTLTIVFLLLTLVTITNDFQKSSDSFKSKTDSQIVESYEFIFQFGSPSIFQIMVYPLSFKKYLNEIEKNSDKNVKHMNYEWARYESFKTFPKDCAVSTLRLAQAGFYYIGKGEEVVCFCCGIKHEKWKNNESVNELHKRLSPNCKLMNGEKTENVPIHGTEESEQDKKACAIGGPEDLPENNTVRTREETERLNVLSRRRNETELNIEQTNTPAWNRNQNWLENERHSFIQNGYSGRYSEFRPTEEIQHFPGITNEQPKHPDYATRGVRLSSFLNWPLGHLMKPEDLAEAGFFFGGMQDLVRCFFCGGGMKNWEYGDSPWIEHARWFPNCAYLKQCKGEDFVNLCQMSNMTFPTQTNFQMRDFDSQQANIAEDQYITDLNSIAAKRVLDMGYVQTQVEDAIRNIRQRIGPNEELKAQNILEYLLDNSYTRSNASATRTTTQGQQSDTTHNRSQSSSPNTRQSDQSNVSIDTTGRTSTERSADKTPKATKDERKSLKEENQHLKEQMMCKICMDKDANIVFLPCGHLVSCVECAHALRKCAVCRTVIQGTVRAYPA